MEKKSISSGTFNEKPPKQFQFLIFFPTLFFFSRKPGKKKNALKNGVAGEKKKKEMGICDVRRVVTWDIHTDTERSIYTSTFIHSFIHTYIHASSGVGCWLCSCCFVPLSLLLPCCVHCSPTLPRRFDVFSSALPSPPAQASQHMNLISIQNIYHTIAYYYHLWHCLVHAPSCTASVSLTL